MRTTKAQLAAKLAGTNTPSIPLRGVDRVGSNRSGTTKLTAPRADRIVALLRSGQHRATACYAAGVSDRAFRDWVSLGEAGDERWSDFAQRVREAEAECETRAIVQIQAIGENDWRALAWWLERRFPTRWGDAKAASARVDAERETIFDAMERVLQSRGLGDAAEEILRDIAGVGVGEAARAVVESRAEH